MEIKQPDRWIHTSDKIIEAVIGFEEWMKKSKEKFNETNHTK